MTHRIIAAVAACSMLLVFSSCKKGSGQDDPASPGAVVKVCISGDFAVSTYEGKNAAVIGTFSLMSDRKGTFKTLDGTVSQDTANVVYNAAEFPVSDVISAARTLVDSTIKEDELYLISVHFKNPSFITIFERGDSAVGLDSQVIWMEQVAGVDLKHRGTQRKDLYRIDIDKEGKATVTPAN